MPAADHDQSDYGGTNAAHQEHEWHRGEGQPAHEEADEHAEADIAEGELGGSQEVGNADEDDHEPETDERATRVRPPVVDQAGGHQPCDPGYERGFEEHPWKATLADVDNGCGHEHDCP